jgi:uncharacterized protein (DUF2235 family)
MALNIILLSDGTGNSAAKRNKTNVWRVYQALNLADGSQVAFYDDGVGTSSFKPLALLGGIFGWGLKRNIIALYMFLCRNYRLGDDIYGFGFSRGAFTIRMLIKLALAKGLITDFNSSDDLRHKARKVFREFQVVQSQGGRLSRMVRSLVYLCLRPLEPTQTTLLKVPSVAFVGVWDTVDAYGMPIEEFKIAIDRYIWPLALKDRELDRGIEKACHALSIDEARASFHPLLWEEIGSDSDLAQHTDQERLTQIWFPGVHANIGGGYPDDGLSNVTLRWMVEEARKKGLLFNARAIDEFTTGSVLFGRMYNSRAGLGAYYRYQPRRLDPPVDEEGACIPYPKFHESVIWRMAAGTDGYAPLNLPAQLRIVLGEQRTSGASAAANASAPNIYDFAGYQRFIQNEVSPSGVPTATGAGPLLRARVAPKIPELQKPDSDALDLMWDTVWWRRVSYFAALGATLLLPIFPMWMAYFDPLVVFPIFWPLSAVVNPTLVKIIGLAQSMLPAPVSGLLDPYRADPWLLINLVTIIMALLIWGGMIDRRIHDRALAAWFSDWRAKRANWLHRSAALRIVAGLLVAIFFALAVLLYIFLAIAMIDLFSNWGPFREPTPPKSASELAWEVFLRAGVPIGICGLLAVTGLLSAINGWRLRRQTDIADREVSGIALRMARKLRTSSIVTRSYNVLTRRIGPPLFACVLIVFGSALLNRFSFLVMTAGGLVCPRTEASWLLPEERPESKEYTFSDDRGCHSLGIYVADGDTYEVRVTLTTPQVGMWAFAAPFLRRFDQPWFEPIILIGSEEYVPDESMRSSLDHVSSAKFRITSGTGEMFIFLNEPVIGLPVIWNMFYRLNAGTFEVTVRKGL